MKKVSIWIVSVALLVSSCGTYAGQGAYAGASFGSVLGSAIGGISGGWRGSDIGTVVGMAGGAAVGAAIGSAADKKQQERMDGYYNRPEQRERQYARVQPVPNNKVSNDIIIRHARFIDANNDGILKAGEECKITFEIMNHTNHTLFDVQPTVYDVTGNKHLHISPNLLIESIAPNSGVRYTATVLAGKKLKDGTVKIRVGATLGYQGISANEQELTLVTRRK